MAVLTIGSYAVPPPLMESYEVTTEPEADTHMNTMRVEIAEFVRYRRRIRWGYARLSAVNYAAISAAMKADVIGTLRKAVPVTFWDPDSNSFQTGNFVGQKTAPKLRNFAPSARYTDVYFELVEQ